MLGMSRAGFPAAARRLAGVRPGDTVIGPRA